MVLGIGVGRVVHFIPGNGFGVKDPTRHIAAIIVSLADPFEEGTVGVVNLRLLYDGTNDHPNWKDEEWKTLVCFDETCSKPYSWHYPEGSMSSPLRPTSARSIGGI